MHFKNYLFITFFNVQYKLWITGFRVFPSRALRLELFYLFLSVFYLFCSRLHIFYYFVAHNLPES